MAATATTATAKSSLCEIYRFDCDSHSGTIKELGAAANAQQAGFSRIFPWKKQCDEGDYERRHVHYVALARTKEGASVICGWMTAIWKKEFDQNYVYISEISTRRIKDEYYGGVGQRLHARLLADAKDQEFIYLFPLDETVVPIYEKWGYKIKRPEISHMFLALTGEPGKELLDSLMPPNPRSELYFPHELAMRKPRDAQLLDLMSFKRRYIINQPGLIRRLVTAREEIEGTHFIEKGEGISEKDGEWPLAKQRAKITEIFQNVKRGGSRRHKRHKKHKRELKKTRKLRGEDIPLLRWA